MIGSSHVSTDAERLPSTIGPSWSTMGCVDTNDAGIDSLISASERRRPRRSKPISMVAFFFAYMVPLGVETGIGCVSGMALGGVKLI